MHGAGMQRQMPALAELGVPHGEHPLVPVDVVTIEAQRFANSHARGAQKTDQGLIGGGPQRRGQPSSCVHQRGDVSVGVQIRHGPAFGSGEQPSWRDFGVRVERLEMAGEAPHRAQPVAQIGRMGVVAGQCGPRHGQLGGDRRRAGRLHIGDEVLEEPRTALQFGSQLSADSYIVLDCLVQIGHFAPPGQGWAMLRSAS